MKRESQIHLSNHHENWDENPFFILFRIPSHISIWASPQLFLTYMEPEKQYTNHVTSLLFDILLSRYEVLYHLCCLSWCNLTSPDWYLITNLLTLHNCWRHVNAAMAVTYWCIIALYKSCTYSNLNRQTKVNFYLWVTGK